MESPAGNIKHCRYEEGHCTLEDSSVLIWSVNLEEKCQFVHWRDELGRKWGNNWLALDGNIALTFTKTTWVKDCEGDNLGISDQGVAFKDINSTRLKRAAYWVHELKMVTRNAASGDLPNGVVMSDQLAMQLQGLELSIEQMLRDTFVMAMHETCRAMTMVVQQLQSALIANPTLSMRQLLRRTDIHARAAGSAIEVWPCEQLEFGHYSFLPMNGTCTKEIPIQFEVQDKTLQGFLDPTTNIISHSGAPVDCNMEDEIPLCFESHFYLYTHETGKLERADGKFTPMKLQQPNLTQALLWKPTIFHQLIMYNITDFQSHISMNDLMADLHIQGRILQQLGVNVRNDPLTSQAARIAMKVTNHGLFGFLSGMNFSKYQL